MGCEQSEATVPSGKSIDGIINRKWLTVATLNYCGIMNSPFQFYCEEFQTQLKELSSIFLSLLPKYVQNFNKDKFRWQMGKLDVKFRTGRYSPLFCGQVGVENSKMVGEQQFKQKWQEVFKTEMAKIQVEWKQSQKQVLKMYDLISYHCMIKYVYKAENIKQVQGRDPSEYLKKLKPFYQLSFLNEERKLEKTIANFSKLQADIFFFQEYSEYFYEYLKNRKEHHIVFDTTKDTMIIAKKSSFNQKKNVEQILGRLTQEQRKNLNWADRTSFMCVDNYLLLNAHLSSKQEKNKIQIKQLETGLLSLRQMLPEYQIILGGDLNSYLPPTQPFVREFYMFPDKDTELTTIKKRTMTQGQFHKAQKIVQESKDKIISTLKMEHSSILYISGKNPKKQSYVPSDEHPFDHFVLVSTLLKKEEKSK